MHWFDVLGLSLSSERALAPIAELVRDLRAQSKNTQLLVVVGGPLVTQRKDIIDALGVDDAFSTAQGVPEALAKSLPKP
jgi:methylmalonyl-CoA mutase cobalamin-binding subunit